MREHVYQHLPGWFDWPELYSDAVANAPTVARFVEVGCWLGKSLSFLAIEAANSGKQIEISAIDTWEGSDEPEQRAIADKIDLYVQFHRNMNIYGLLDMIRVVRLDSVRAAAAKRTAVSTSCFWTPDIRSRTCGRTFVRGCRRSDRAARLPGTMPITRACKLPSRSCCRAGSRLAEGAGFTRNRVDGKQPIA